MYQKRAKKQAPKAPAQQDATEIMKLGEAGLIGILQKPGSPVFAKAKACQRLAVIGTKQAVPVLASLLADKQLSHYARTGLEANPDPSVDEAFRNALGKLNGILLVGVINSIGQRRDAKALNPLLKLLNDKDAEVAKAAAAALGRISGAQAAGALEKALRSPKAPVFPAVADAALVCAEGLLAQGSRRQAHALYSALSRPDVPKAVRTAAELGIKKA